MDALQATEAVLLTLVVSHSLIHTKRDLREGWDNAKRWLKLETVEKCRPHQIAALSLVVSGIGLLALSPAAFYCFELLSCIFERH